MTKNHAPLPTASRKSKTPVPGHIQKRLEKIWKQAYGAKNQDDLVKLYAEWSESYDVDHEAVGFFGHITASRLLARRVADKAHSHILDAGAGTGAAGFQLARLGFGNLTAVDLSSDMLAKAADKGVYQNLVQADLGVPMDDFRADTFDAAILVGVFSYGQAPAHALDEIVRVVKPGGIIVFTMRTDFHDSDAMSVRSRMAALEQSKAWQLVEVTDPELYLPNKDSEATFRAWCYRVLETKTPPVDEEFAKAARQALTADDVVKRFDHRYIWNSTASHLYNQYIERPEYYLNDCEEEILASHAEAIIGPENVIVELGCGNAQKIKHLLTSFHQFKHGSDLTYVPIDLSPAALEETRVEIEDHFGEQVNVEPIHAPFHKALSEIPSHHYKLILFFGSSIGNLESIEETIDFLAMVRENMSPGDRFVVGMDLHKEEHVLRQAYQAGEPNRRFFLNIIRRMNNELGADFDLDAFVQDSSYDEETPYQDIENRCVNFKLVARTPQRTRLKRVGLDVELRPGEAIQVGTSRKFRKRDIELLASQADLELRRQWVDRRGYFSVNELVPANGTM